jgi:hypothetical protein
MMLAPFAPCILLTLVVILYGDAAMDTIAGDNNNKVEEEDDLSGSFDAVMRGGNPLREDEYCDIHILIPLHYFQWVVMDSNSSKLFTQLGIFHCLLQMRII